MKVQLEANGKLAVSQSGVERKKDCENQNCDTRRAYCTIAREANRSFVSCTVCVYVCFLLYSQIKQTKELFLL